MHLPTYKTNGTTNRGGLFLSGACLTLTPSASCIRSSLASISISNSIAGILDAWVPQNGSGNCFAVIKGKKTPGDSWAPSGHRLVYRQESRFDSVAGEEHCQAKKAAAKTARILRPPTMTRSGFSPKQRGGLFVQDVFGVHMCM